MKTISLKLPEAMANQLAKRARQLGRSQSDLVRQALEEQQRGKKKNCAELLSELGGFFEGPRDLSTNPKYIKDFGK